jgi:hypothetical protein
MNDHPGRLLDDEQLGILVHDHELAERSAGARRRDGRRRDGDRLAAAQAVVLAREHAVERHCASLDAALRLGARAEVPREELVQPLAGGLRRDAQRLHRDQR